MLNLYTVKYDGANVTAVLTAIKPIMESRYEAGSSPMYNAVEVARRILSANGVPPAMWGIYLAFAQQIAKYQFSHSGATLQKVLSGIKAFFVTAHGADPAILDSIIAELTGVAPAY
jgi:ABC-type Fe3+ transport system substrate-binding protein